jgi:argininosuccinate synthase
MRTVLAYAGGPAGAAAVHWLRQRLGSEVVTVTLDLGQRADLEAVRDGALALGAHRAHVLDAREQLAREFVVPLLRADAMHDGRVPLVHDLNRPVIALRLVEIARIERADHLAHTTINGGATSSLDGLLAALDPDRAIVNPARAEALEPGGSARAASNWASAPPHVTGLASNLWGSCARKSAHPSLATRLQNADPRPPEPASISIAFVRGVPSALNGVEMPLVDLIGSLGTLASTFGIGQVASGSYVCDAPAAVLLHAAHRALTDAASADEVQTVSESLRRRYVDLVESGGWFSPLRFALDAYFASAQEPVTGRVRMRLNDGEVSMLAVELQAASPTTISSQR